MFETYLFRAAAVLLVLGTLGHTFGGILGTARKGPQAGAEADRVFDEMKRVAFVWNGAHSTWHGFWLGNGLSVSCLLPLFVVVLWILGGIHPAEAGPWLAVAWTCVVCLAAISAVSIRFFGARVGGVFGLITALTLGGAALLTRAAV